MSKYRFCGTVKRIEWKSGRISSIAFVPDMEYSSSYKNDKDEKTTYAVFQPVDDKAKTKKDGFVVKYDKEVVFAFAKDGYIFVCGTHVVLTLDGVNKKKDSVFTLQSTKHYFKLDSIEIP